MNQRIGSAVFWLTVLCCSGLVTGCATECDLAVCALAEVCGIVNTDPGDGECDPEMESFNACVNRNTPAACDYLNDPVAHSDNAFARCLAE